MREIASTKNQDFEPAVSPWVREAGLLASVGTGFAERAKKAFSPDHIGETGVEVSLSAAAGVALRIASQSGGKWGKLATASGYALVGLAGLDVNFMSHARGLHLSKQSFRYL